MSSTAPFGTGATVNTTTRQDSNRNGVINEDELIDDLSPPWNQAQSNCRPPITLGSLRIHSHRRRLDAVVIVTRKEKNGALKRDPSASQSSPSIKSRSRACKNVFEANQYIACECLWFITAVYFSRVRLLQCRTFQTILTWKPRGCTRLTPRA